MTPPAPPAGDSAALARWAGEALRDGHGETVAAVLRARAGRDATLLRLLGLALRSAQRPGAAEIAFRRGRVAAPDDPTIAVLAAQTRFELGFPAAADFATARALAPGNAEVTRNHALALAAEGRTDAAIALLEEATRATPGWLDGQRVLATLRWTSALPDPFAGYAAATAREPRNRPVWLAWFAAVAQQRDWPAARAVLAAARRALGETRGLLLAEAFVAVESDDRNRAAELLACTAGDDDPGLGLCRIRFALRTGAYERARDEAARMIAGPAAAQAWPYLGLAWRLLDDSRADWLEADPRLVASYDIDLGKGGIDELATLLRALHTARAAYGDQSVRGGTQTDRSVLLRREPILRRARRRLMAAVAQHVAALPPPDPGHPLLGRRRDRLRIAGSWSVRLRDGGHNVAHTHPHGWLSSAFYVALPPADMLGAAPSGHLALPPADMLGAAPSGHLALGTAPAELGLDLAPRRTIAPAVGRLVLFPSTMWHATIPFAAGERLNIAFDIVPAAG